jgi:2-keto-4-pentenoate hydratase/2-oxohepta-3-ene-1,7-dioic acid hydratase in catechol pathway
VKIVRFSGPPNLGLGSDPLFGVLNDKDSILVLQGDPIYSGIVPQDKSVKLSEVNLLSPVIPRSKVVCIGKNYADHAAEMDSEVPQEPIIFIKPNTSVTGPNETIIWPKMSERVDHEVELAVVIGRICKEVPAEKSADVIFGYTIANDVTARDLQKRDGQWSRAKGFDTFCPLGPWIDTEFVPGNQKITATLNGELKQSANLSSMIFKIPKIIEFVTNVMTLLPGDVILTGTPAGIGPMPAGATISLSIDGLGTLNNKVSSRVN